MWSAGRGRSRAQQAESIELLELAVDFAAELEGVEPAWEDSEPSLARGLDLVETHNPCGVGRASTKTIAGRHPNDPSLRNLPDFKSCLVHT